MRNWLLVAGGIAIIAIGALFVALSGVRRAVEQAAAAAAVAQFETVSAANRSGQQTAESAVAAAEDALIRVADLNTQVAAVAATSDWS